jgi:peptidyl-prolyl cis-trans isomerase A (cyclophilin A)
MLKTITIGTLIIFATVHGCKSSSEPPKKEGEEMTATKEERTVEKTPEKFTVKLKTTKGDIMLDVTRAWAPRGADRFFELVTSGYYEDVAFFRVIEGFMAQAGIHGTPAMNAKWRNKRIQDDPVKESNKRGMVSYAMGGPGSRTTQFFINFKDNTKLDQMGFAPFAKVRDMAVVDSIYNVYGEGAPRGSGPSQARIQREGNAYLKKEFPELDYILSASIVK